MDLPALQFAPAGGVNAASIGAEAPDCGPKAQPVIGPDGEWVCQPVAHEEGSLGRLVVVGFAVAVMIWVYGRRAHRTFHAVKGGDLGALL